MIAVSVGLSRALGGFQPVQTVLNRFQRFGDSESGSFAQGSRVCPGPLIVPPSRGRSGMMGQLL
jgi:hypothetical protein